MTSPASPPLPRPLESLRSIGGLRDRIRRAFLLDGAVAVALMVMALAGLILVLDYLLVLPRGVRLVLEAGAAGYLAWFLVRRLWLPARLPLADEDLAVLVEARSPELAQALITAVQLSRPDHPGVPLMSRELIGNVIGEVERARSAVEPRKVIDLRPVRKNSVLLALVFLFGGIGTILRPDLASIGARRFFLLADVGWPKWTELELVSPASNPVVVAMGDDLNVEVRVVRGNPPKIEIEVDGGRWSDPMIEGGDGAFRKVFENVSGSFVFRVRGGDDELPEVQVDARVQPVIIRLDAWYRYPDYTGLDPTPAERPVANPNLIAVPRSTRVAVRAWVEPAIAEAYFLFRTRLQAGEEVWTGPRSRREGPGAKGDAPWPAPGAAAIAVLPAAPRPAPLDPQGPPLPVPGKAASLLEWEFPVESDGSFTFQFRSADGFVQRRTKVVGVRAFADRAPVVKILEPARATEEVSPDATVQVEASLRHTYGIRTATLEGLVVPLEGEKGGPRSMSLVLDPPGGGAPTPREAKNDIRTKLTLDFSKILGLTPGAKFQYYVRAVDYGDHEGRSDGYVFHILTKEDIKRILNDRLMLLRDQVREVAGEQASARKDLQGFGDELTKAAAAHEKGLSLDADAGAKLVRNRQDQERITGRLGRIVKEFDAIAGRMEANRVGEEKEKEWMAGMRAEVDSYASKRSPAVAKALEDLRAEAAGSPQPPDRLAPILEDQRRIERDLQLLALRLTQMGDVNWVIEQLREVQKRQEEIRDQTKKRARAGVESSPPGDGEK